MGVPNYIREMKVPMPIHMSTHMSTHISVHMLYTHACMPKYIDETKILITLPILFTFTCLPGNPDCYTVTIVLILAPLC